MRSAALRFGVGRCVGVGRRLPKARCDSLLRPTAGWRSRNALGAGQQRLESPGTTGTEFGPADESRTRNPDSPRVSKNA